MTILSVFKSSLVTFGIFFFLTAVLARNVPIDKSRDRFDVTINDLHRMCSINNINLFESLLLFQLSYMNISMTATKKIVDSLTAVNSVINLDFFSDEYCKKNSDMKMYLQHFTDLVQNCMDDDHQLDDERKKMVFDMFLTRVCSDLKYGALEKYDDDCFNDKRTKYSFTDCYGNDEPHSVVFKNDYILPLQNHPTKKECMGIFKYYDCVVYSIQHCKETTKQIVESHFEEKKSFSGCEIIVNQV